MNSSQLDTPDYQSRTERQILTAFGQLTLVFPGRFVEEIILVKRSFVLPIPFFVPGLIGLTHSQGRLVPLLSLARLLRDPNALIPEILVVVCVKSDMTNPAVDEIAGAGLVVDRVVGSVTDFSSSSGFSLDPASDYLRFEELLSQIPNHIWQPKRWYS